MKVEREALERKFGEDRRQMEMKFQEQCEAVLKKAQEASKAKSEPRERQQGPAPQRRSPISPGVQARFPLREGALKPGDPRGAVESTSARWYNVGTPPRQAEGELSYRPLSGERSESMSGEGLRAGLGFATGGGAEPQ